jgi:hypothetical protein
MMLELGGVEEQAVVDEAEITVGIEHQYEEGSVFNLSLEVPKFDRAEVVGTYRRDQATIMQVERVPTHAAYENDERSKPNHDSARHSTVLFCLLASRTTPSVGLTSLLSVSNTSLNVEKLAYPIPIKDIRGTRNHIFLRSANVRTLHRCHSTIKVISEAFAGKSSTVRSEQARGSVYQRQLHCARGCDYIIATHELPAHQADRRSLSSFG